MIILIIGLLVFVGAIIYVVVKGKGWCGFAETIVFPALFAIVISFVSMLICLLVSCDIPESAIGEIERTETKLIALKDNMAIGGCHSHYVYHGYIDEELQYSFLYEAEGKGVTSKHCDADKAYINYISSEEVPKLITVKYGVTNPIWKFVTANDLSGCSYEVEYYLYIPEGSMVIENEYKIDFE